MTDAEARKLHNHQRAVLAIILKGFESYVSQTGGNCEALRIDGPDESFYVLVTDVENASINTFGPFDVGLYGDGEDYTGEASTIMSGIPMDELADVVDGLVREGLTTFSPE